MIWWGFFRPFFCKRGGSIIIFIAVSSGIFVWNILYNNTIYQRRLCLHFAFLCHSFIVFRLIQNFCLNRITSSAGVGPRYKKRIVSTVLDKRAFPLLIIYLLFRVLVMSVIQKRILVHIIFLFFPFWLCWMYSTKGKKKMLTYFGL